MLQYTSASWDRLFGRQGEIQQAQLEVYKAWPHLGDIKSPNLLLELHVMTRWDRTEIFGHVHKQWVWHPKQDASCWKEYNLQYKCCGIYLFLDLLVLIKVCAIMNSSKYQDILAKFWFPLPGSSNLAANGSLGKGNESKHTPQINPEMLNWLHDVIQGLPQSPNLIKHNKKLWFEESSLQGLAKGCQMILYEGMVKPPLPNILISLIKQYRRQLSYPCERKVHTICEEMSLGKWIYNSESYFWLLNNYEKFENLNIVQYILYYSLFVCLYWGCE